MGSNRILMIPKFNIPTTFTSEDDYLRHLTYKGAECHYKEITVEIRNRIDFELEAIKTKGFAGYFLMVQEIIQATHEMNIVLGPGRVAAGCSIVNCCLKITEIDPIKFDLPLERFLNPDQNTLPHFDFDLEVEGRDNILRWLIEKYGKDNVAQMATFAPNEKLKINPCSIIIGAENLEKFIPVATIKPWYSDEEMLFTSCEKSTIEELGLVKLNFLPLTVLSVIKKTLSNIKKTRFGFDIDISKIPLDDAKTFELFREGDTDGVFQFESEEMKSNLHYLQPDKFEDLIALWILQRQGNRDNLSTFINKKRNGDEINYDFLDNYAPKSHAVAYTLIGYRMAYLKANFKKEFLEKEIKFIELTNNGEITHYAGSDVWPEGNVTAGRASKNVSLLQEIDDSQAVVLFEDEHFIVKTVLQNDILHFINLPQSKKLSHFRDEIADLLEHGKCLIFNKKIGKIVPEIKVEKTGGYHNVYDENGELFNWSGAGYRLFCVNGIEIFGVGDWLI